MSISNQILRPKLITPGNNSYDAVIMADRPMVYYPRIDHAAVKDASGHGYTGSISGSYITNERGPWSSVSSAALDGSSAYVSTPYLSGIGIFTLECWLETAVQQGAIFAISSGASLSTTAYQASYFVSSGNAYNGILNTNDSQDGAAGSFEWDFSTWHYTAFQFSLNVVCQQVVDSRIDTASSATSALDAGYVTFGAGSMGGWYNQNGNYVKGRIAACAVYDRILSVPDMLRHYNAGRTALRLA